MAKQTRKKLLESSVTQEKDGTWTAVCPVASGCGDNYKVKGQDDPVHIGYTFRFAPTKALAMDRLDGHFTEHVTGEVIEDIEVWRKRHGLIADADGRGVTVADLEN